MSASAEMGARPPGPVPLRLEARVLANRAEGAESFRMRLAVPGWPGSQPGQFVMLSAGPLADVPRDDPLLPRPMAVYRQPAEGEIEVLYRREGRGTALMAGARPDDRIALVGPLGRGFPAPRAGERVIAVGGGTGIASLYDFAARAAAEARVTVVLAGRGAEQLMAVEDFAALAIELVLVTEDGSTGERGLATDALERLLDADPVATVHACGPTPMMRRCAEIAEARGVACWVSLENPMACGFGVCLGCAAPRRRGDCALVCRDGPVFDATEIAWEGLP